MSDEPCGVGITEVVTSGHEHLHGDIIERVQVQPHRARLAHECGQKVVQRVASGEFITAVRQENKQRQCGNRLGDETHEVETGRVRPMLVFKDNNSGPFSDRRFEEVENLPEKSSLTADCSDLPRFAERRREGRATARAIALEEIEPRAICGGLREVEAAPGEDERAPLRCLSAERFRERGLADACLSADQHEAAVPGDGSGEVLAQHAEFALAPDEHGRCGTGQGGRIAGSAHRCTSSFGF